MIFITTYKILISTVDLMCHNIWATELNVCQFHLKLFYQKIIWFVIKAAPKQNTNTGRNVQG